MQDKEFTQKAIYQLYSICVGYDQYTWGRTKPNYLILLIIVVVRFRRWNLFFPA